jgi:hypothetical protein
VPAEASSGILSTYLHLHSLCVPQDFVKGQLLIVLEHGACDSGSCFHALSVSLGDTHIQLRDSGSISSSSLGCLPSLLSLFLALWTLVPVLHTAPCFGAQQLSPPSQTPAVELLASVALRTCPPISEDIF